MRKGQKLCNYIQRDGLPSEEVHRILFNMDDKDFDKAMEEI